MFRVATLAVTVVAALLGIAFKGTNISFLVSLAFSVAASANLPVLLLSLYWRGLTRRGALVGGAVGLVTSTGMLIAGPAIWVDVLGYERRAVRLELSDADRAAAGAGHGVGGFDARCAPSRRARRSACSKSWRRRVRLSLTHRDTLKPDLRSANV